MSPKDRLRGIRVETMTTAWLSSPSKPRIINSSPATSSVPNPTV
jgi:hypothetical protein